MRFWNDKKLAEELKEDVVSQKKTLLYFILVGLILSINTFGLGFPTETYSVYDYIIDASIIFFVSIIILTSYRSNTQQTYKVFIKQLICLSLPILIKTTLLFILLASIGGVIDLQYFSQYSLSDLFSDMMAKTDSVIEEASNKTDEEMQIFIEQKVEEVSQPYMEKMTETLSTGPATLGAYVLCLLYALKKYTVCFKIVNGQEEYK